MHAHPGTATERWKGRSKDASKKALLMICQVAGQQWHSVRSSELKLARDITPLFD